MALYDRVLADLKALRPDIDMAERQRRGLTIILKVMQNGSFASPTVHFHGLPPPAMTGEKLTNDNS